MSLQWKALVRSLIPENKKIKFKDPSRTNFNYFGNEFAKEEFILVDLETDNNVYQIDDNIIILDSKYYETYYDNEFPNAKEIVEQKSYNYFITKAMKEENQKLNVHSFFIFPKKKTKNKDPEYFGNYCNDNFCIHFIALDVKTLVEHFQQQKEYLEFHELICSISRK